MKMMVSNVIKIHKITLLQQQIIEMYRGNFTKFPSRPDLFLDSADIKLKQNTIDKLLYLHFSTSKNIVVSLAFFLDKQLTIVDKLAIAIYARYFKSNPILVELISLYPEIADDSIWFE